MPAADALPKVEHLTRAAEYAVFAVDTVVVLVWTGAPSVEGVARCASTFSRMRLARPGTKLGFYTLIEPTAGQGTLPNNVRDALASLLKENESLIGSAVVVFEGTGFKATVVRSVITAIQMASRPKFRSSVHADRRLGAERLVDELGASTRITVGALVSLLRDQSSRPAA